MTSVNLTLAERLHIDEQRDLYTGSSPAFYHNMVN